MAPPRGGEAPRFVERMRAALRDDDDREEIVVARIDDAGLDAPPSNATVKTLGTSDSVDLAEFRRGGRSNNVAFARHRSNADFVKTAFREALVAVDATTSSSCRRQEIIDLQNGTRTRKKNCNAWIFLCYEDDGRATTADQQTRTRRRWMSLSLYLQKLEERARATSTTRDVADHVDVPEGRRQRVLPPRGARPPPGSMIEFEDDVVYESSSDDDDDDDVNAAAADAPPEPMEEDERTGDHDHESRRRRQRRHLDDDEGRPLLREDCVVRPFLNDDPVLPPRATGGIGSEAARSWKCRICHDDLRTMSETSETSAVFFNYAHGHGCTAVFDIPCLKKTLNRAMKNREKATCGGCVRRDGSVVKHELSPRMLSYALTHEEFVLVQDGMKHLSSSAWRELRDKACPHCGVEVRPGLVLLTWGCSNNMCSRTPLNGYCLLCDGERPPSGAQQQHVCPRPDLEDSRTFDALVASGVVMTRPCPSCRVASSKANPRECNHMTCGVCQTQFCALCGAARPDSGDWMDHACAGGVGIHTRNDAMVRAQYGL